MILGFSLGFWITVTILFLLRIAFSIYNWILLKQMQSRLDEIEDYK